MSTTRTNRKLLISVCLQNQPADRVRRCWSVDVDRLRWETLILDASREGLTPLFYRGLHEMGLLDLVPTMYADRLAAVYYQTVRSNLKLMAAAEELVHTATRSGIRLIILQGMSLQGDIYVDPGVRPMADIDLWIAPSEIDAFSDILRRLGYVHDALYPGSWESDDIKLDIHTHLFWADRLRSRQWLTHQNDDEFIERSENFQLGGVTARRLGCEDQVIYLGLHALKHNVDRLIWLVDIFRIVEETGKNQFDGIISPI
jgi:hypothetical protein